ncbi:hypothetical protein JTB14_034065 [Gonioctena quinquepunctata]|nr:hypothetical protein JTB14_034065 [Gonioctena quinquepunctata]
MVVMIFGAVSSPTSAQFVMRKNAAEFEQAFPEAFNAITERHYVDDFLDSFDTIEEAKKVPCHFIEVHRRGGFRIRNWASNSKEVLKNIPEEYRSRHQKDMNLEKKTVLPTDSFGTPTMIHFPFR